MATHSSVLAWRIPGTKEPSGLLSKGSRRVGHNWSDLAAAAAEYSDIAQSSIKIEYIQVYKLEHNLVFCLQVRASLVAQRLKHLPPMWETRVQSLGREDPLEKEMVTHSSILAWRIPWMEKPGRLQSTGSQRVGHNWATSLSLFYKLEGILRPCSVSFCKWELLLAIYSDYFHYLSLWR